MGPWTALNERWTTAFWGQRYTAWEQVDVPRQTPTSTTTQRKSWTTGGS